MGQNSNSDDQYSTGYGGYGRYTSPQPQQGTTPQSQPYDAGQAGGTQPGSQQAGYQGYQSASSGQQQQYQQQTYQQQTYQQQTYQPPLSATRSESMHSPTSTGLSGRTEALLSYLFWCVGGIVFFIIERKNRFVRFQAAQSLLFFGPVLIVLEVLHLITLIPLLGFLLLLPVTLVSYIIGFVAMLVWLFMLFQMYRGKNFRLPFVSGYAESLVERTTFRKKKTV